MTIGPTLKFGSTKKLPSFLFLRSHLDVLKSQGGGSRIFLAGAVAYGRAFT